MSKLTDEPVVAAGEPSYVLESDEVRVVVSRAGGQAAPITFFRASIRWSHTTSDRGRPRPPRFLRRNHASERFAGTSSASRSAIRAPTKESRTSSTVRHRTNRGASKVHRERGR